MTTLSISKFAASLAAAALTLAFTSPSLQAQSPETRSKVNVPFSFEVGTRHFEPGVYSIAMQSGNVLIVTNGTKAAMEMIRVDAGSKPGADSKVVFQHVGDQYFLSQVWTAGETEHIQCVPSKGEQQAQKLQASNQAPASTVAVALMLASR
jgi:hypothetical protein